MKKTLGIGALVLALGGCGIDADEHQLISGQPVSVSGNGRVLSIALNVEGKPFLGYQFVNSDIINYVIAEALIESEISDQDEERIELYGRYNEDVFEIEKIYANGYQIDLLGGYSNK
jgi:hypothetical protein